MLPLSIGDELVGSLRQARASAKLQEQVTRLFEEARDDVYRYLLTLGLYPPQAQEATQEVFLRLYSALRKGEKIRKPRGWIFRVAHNLGVDIRAQAAIRNCPTTRKWTYRLAAQRRQSRAGTGGARAHAAIPSGRGGAVGTTAPLPVLAPRRIAVCRDCGSLGHQLVGGRRVLAARH